MNSQRQQCSSGSPLPASPHTAHLSPIVRNYWYQQHDSVSSWFQLLLAHSSKDTFPRQQQEHSSTRGKQSSGEAHLHQQRYGHPNCCAETGGLSRELATNATEGQTAGATGPGAFPLHDSLHWLNPPAAALHPYPPAS